MLCVYICKKKIYEIMDILLKINNAGFVASLYKKKIKFKN